jgi:hypothetical protein
MGHQGCAGLPGRVGEAWPGKGEWAGAGKFGRLGRTQEIRISNEFGFWKDFEEFYKEI